MPVEPGCRCAQCFAGLPHEPIVQPTSLRVVTRGKPSTRHAAQDAGERLVATARAGCAACGGDAQRCMDGTGAPLYARLAGCAAWTADGGLKPLAAKAQPRQPWEARRAA